MNATPRITTQLLKPGLLTLALLSGHATAQSGDASNSNMVIGADTTTYLKAEGTLRVDGANNDDHLFAILPVAGTNWDFEIWTEGRWQNWGIQNLNLALEGTHIRGPHRDDVDPNPLPFITLSSTRIGTVDIRWGKKAVVSFGSSVDHNAGQSPHKDWYGLFYNPVALDADPDNGLPRRVSGWAGLIGMHRGHEAAPFDPGWETCGWSDRSGASAAFDPDTGTLTLAMAAIDIADRDGGRTRSIDPRYGDDPVLGVQTELVQLRLVGFDDVHGEHVFRGGELYSINPDTGLRFGGTLGEFRVSTTLDTESMGAWGAFQPIALVDPAEDADTSSAWADDFSRRAWLGEGLDEDGLARLRYPVLSLTTPLDLVEATDGFTRPALVPATILLTVARGQPEQCRADINGDGVVNTLDVLFFLNAWSERRPEGDFNEDGVVNTLDVLFFLNAWSERRPEGDFNEDGIVNTLDVLDFLNAWTAACE
ncbi:MAG: hypothetical protein HND58_18755 [Planctomycetota bacterium]|nr:MAG: hypothetical protein HND58_18755 [Planctomycetota bacterium]